MADNYRVESKTVRKDVLPVAVDAMLSLVSVGMFSSTQEKEEHTVTNERTGQSVTFDKKEDALDFIKKDR